MGLPRLRLVVATFFLPLAVLAGGCAQASPPAQPPAPPGEAEAGAHQQQAGYGQPAPGAVATAAAQPPADASWFDLNAPPAADRPGLEQQLARAEQAIEQMLGAGDAGDSVRNVTRPAAKAGRNDATPVASGDPCLVACAALASMKRSANHLCGMAGEADVVCGGARERVQRAEQRVTQACPACAAK